MHGHDVRSADFENELPDRFEKWQAFDVAGGAADLSNYDIVFRFIGNFADSIFDLVRHVWNHLDRLA